MPALLLASCLADRSVIITGVIKVQGNEPHTQLVVETPEGKRYVISGDKAEYLKKEKQNNTVKLKGKTIQEPKSLRPGSFEVTQVE